MTSENNYDRIINNNNLVTLGRNLRIKFAKILNNQLS